jgi:hypothetical protein
LYHRIKGGIPMEKMELLKKWIKMKR